MRGWLNPQAVCAFLLRGWHLGLLSPGTGLASGTGSIIRWLSDPHSWVGGGGAHDKDVHMLST